jgi:hypothetical protein
MMKCCICNEEIPVEAHGWDKGHHAGPIVPEGRCCNDCQYKHVIPARIRRIKGDDDE